MINKKAFGARKTLTILMVFSSSVVFGQIDLLPPIARNDSKNTRKDVSVTINVVENDSDGDIFGGINERTVDLNMSKDGIQDSVDTPDGKFKVNSSGVVTFDPKRDFLGIANAEYTVQDDSGKTSNVATISITVSVNSAPVASNDNATTNENASVSVNVVGNDSDSDGTINVATVDLNTSQNGIQSSVNNSQGSFVASSGVVTYTPADDFSGTATINYTVNDNEGETSNTATITITVNALPNRMPVAVNDAGTTSENTPVNINVVANDTDSDGTINPSSVDLNVSQAGTQQTNSTSQGNFSVNNSGVVTYSPANNFSGTATLKYVVKDNEGGLSNEATITVSVSSVNAAPVAVDDKKNTDQNIQITIAILENDRDSDGTLDATTVDLNPDVAGTQKNLNIEEGSLTVNATGVITYTPAENFLGKFFIGYTVKDNEGAISNEATVSIEVKEVPTGFTLDIPGGFTPNGDGANETWKISMAGEGSLSDFSQAEVKVFNRRGVLVYETHGFEKPWDGSHNGKILPADTYYFVIDLKQRGNVRKGVVTILR